MYKKFYQSFLEAHEEKIHFAAHSHHFWPDITEQATAQAWKDSAKLSDQKWNYIFKNVFEKSQQHIADILNLSHPEQIAFAPNTHELLSRLFSCFLDHGKFKILTTKSEFHSLSRQLKRMLELPHVEAIIIDNEQHDFQSNFLENLQTDVDLIFISHVFYNSGTVLPMSFIKKIQDKKKAETLFCLDGYHGFCAIPTDLSQLEHDIFYLGGGYKYAQAGEGACFMTIPKNCKLRPVNTGWFASFETLDNPSEKVSYSNNGFRFCGATQDMTPWYRFNSVWDQFKKEQIDIPQIHNYIQSLQLNFIERIEEKDLFISTDLEKIGHFLTLDLRSYDHALSLYEELLEQNILTDFRANRLRFGFGLYLNIEDIECATNKINVAIKKNSSLAQ